MKPCSGRDVWHISILRPFDTWSATFSALSLVCQWVVQAAGPHKFQIQKGLASAHSLLCVLSRDIYSLGHTSYSEHPLRIWIWMCLPTFQGMVAQASSLFLFFWFLILFHDCDYLFSCETPWGLICLVGTNIGFIREFLTTFASLLHSDSELETFAKYPESLNPNALVWPCPLCSLKAALCTQPSSWLSAWLSSST